MDADADVLVQAAREAQEDRARLPSGVRLLQERQGAPRKEEGAGGGAANVHGSRRAHVRAARWCCLGRRGLGRARGRRRDASGSGRAWLAARCCRRRSAPKAPRVGRQDRAAHERGQPARVGARLGANPVCYA